MGASIVVSIRDTTMMIVFVVHCIVNRARFRGSHAQEVEENQWPRSKATAVSKGVPEIEESENEGESTATYFGCLILLI